MFMKMSMLARSIVGCVLFAGVMYTLDPDAEYAQSFGAVVCEYVQYVIQPKAIPAETYTEMIMIRVGLMEQRYESWGDRATQLYIYLVVLVTISVYVCCGIVVLFIVDCPEKKKNADTTSESPKPTVVTAVHDTNVNNNKQSDQEDEIDECTTQISLLSDDCVMLQAACDKQSVVMHGFMDQMERLDRSGMVAWKCFMVMLLIVIGDIILHLAM